MGCSVVTFGSEWADRFLYEFLFEDAVPLAVQAH